MTKKEAVPVVKTFYEVTEVSLTVCKVPGVSDMMKSQKQSKFANQSVR